MMKWLGADWLVLIRQENVPIMLKGPRSCVQPMHQSFGKLSRSSWPLWFMLWNCLVKPDDLSHPNWLSKMEIVPWVSLGQLTQRLGRIYSFCFLETIEKNEKSINFREHPFAIRVPRGKRGVGWTGRLGLTYTYYWYYV